MTTETRPVCVYAMPNLKRNSTRLMVAMCIGIALSLYGIYVQTRSSSNPNYSPSVSVASSWLYHNVGQHLMSPSFLTNGGSCVRDRQPRRPSFGQLFMYRFVYPTMRYSAIVNGFINLSQIILLKVYCKSRSGTDAIIGLSAFGIGISLICLIGSFAFCKLMCLSCLCIHHIVIIYLAIKRRRMVQNYLCPPGASTGACTFGPNTGASGGPGSRSGSGSSGGSGGRFGLTPTATGQQKPASAGKHGAKCVTRNTGSGTNHDSTRRRSNRT